MTGGEPVFLAGRAGALFAMRFLPEGAAEHGVILLPPFAEEMNRARRMLHCQAVALAEAGIAALLLDPFGTGDSAGDFAEADWDTWREDVRSAATALAALGVRRIGLLGLRLGALLAAAAAPNLGAACFATVLWQPVAQGRRHLSELLRLRSLPGTAAPPATVEALRAELAEGRTVEVAGYDIAPALAASLDGLELSRMADPALGQVAWFDVLPDPALPSPAAAAQCRDAWIARGIAVATATIPGPAFWTGQGNALAPALLTATTAAFQGAA